MTFNKEDLRPRTGHPVAIPARERDETEIARRSRAFLGIHVANPVHRVPLEALDRLRAATPGRADQRQYAVRVTGASGSGKSTLAKSFRDAVMARGQHGRNELPVVYVELEQACTVKRMWSAILYAYEDEFHDEGTLEDMRARGLRIIRERRTLLLMIDEVQHLFHRSKDGLAATDAFKRLLDAGVCSLALIGDLEGRRLLQSNPQLVNRMVSPADVRVLDASSPADLATVAGFLKRYDAKLVKADLHTDLSGLDDPRVVAGLMDIGGGLLGVMVNVIREASDHAHLRGATRIEAYDLATAARTWSEAQGRQKHNPFVLQA